MATKHNAQCLEVLEPVEICDLVDLVRRQGQLLHVCNVLQAGVHLLNRRLLCSHRQGESTKSVKKVCVCTCMAEEKVGQARIQMDALKM